MLESVIADKVVMKLLQKGNFTPDNDVKNRHFFYLQHEELARAMGIEGELLPVILDALSAYFFPCSGPPQRSRGVLTVLQRILVYQLTRVILRRPRLRTRCAKICRITWSST